MSRMDQYEDSLYFNEDYSKNDVSMSNLTKNSKIIKKPSKKFVQKDLINRAYNNNQSNEEINFTNKNLQNLNKLIRANNEIKRESYLDEAFENNEFNKNIYNRKEYLSSLKDEFENEELDYQDNNIFGNSPNKRIENYYNNNNINNIKDFYLQNSNLPMNNTAKKETLDEFKTHLTKDFDYNYSKISHLNNINNTSNVNDFRKKSIEDNFKKIGKWSEEEDKILSDLVQNFGGKNWKKISEFIPGRTSIQCLHRWTKILQPGLVKGPWTIEEDRKLLDWIRKEGPTKWTQCADFIKGRNGKQCRERWFHTLNPKIVKGNWTCEEDFKIFTLYDILGGKWAKIAVYVLGRTENSIKNRFYSTLRRKAAEKMKNENNGKNSKGEDCSKNSSPINSNNNSNFSGSENSHLSLEDDIVCKKGNNIQNCVTSLSLEELLKYLPSAKFEVMLKLMKSKNMTSEQIKEYEKNIVNSISNNKKNGIEQNNYFPPTNNYNNCPTYPLNNNNSNKIINNTINPYINLNLNFNSNSHNNFILPNKFQNPNSNNFAETNFNKNNKNFLDNNYCSKDSKFSMKLNNSNINSEGINENLRGVEKNIFSNQISDFRNMDIFSLEDNILEMCDNPAFFYSDSNFNFLDCQVDNIIDSMFTKNNIVLTNKDNENCNLCLSNSNNRSELKNYQNENSKKNIKFESNHLNINNNQCKKDEEIEKVNPTQNNEQKIKETENSDNKERASQGEKKVMLNSLIMQLEDLEKLVNSTKNELLKFTKNEKDSGDDILNKTNLKSLNSKIESLFK